MDWNTIPESFRKEIERNYVVLQRLKQPSGWGTTTVGECASLIRENVDPSGLDGVPYIGLEHIGEGSLSLIGVGSASDVTSTKSCFRHGDILFGKLRPYFRKVVRPSFDGICSTDIWVIRPKQNVETQFLFYILADSDFIELATRGAEGTRMPRAKWDFVSSHRVSLPSIAEQRRIAEVLGVLDDRIELNRRMCETLEEMAQALYKAWFVDFEPVRAKMEGRWREGESLPGLPVELYHLFPDELIDSQLGLMPRGWRSCRLDEVADHLRQTVDPSRSPDLEYRHYSIPAFDSGKRPVTQPGKAILSNKCVVHPSTVLLSRLNPDVERVWLVGPEPGAAAIASTEFAVLRPKQPIDSSFLYCTLRSHRYRNVLVGLVTGTSKSHQRVRPQALAATTLIMPPPEVSAEFSILAAQWLEQTLKLQSMSQDLADLRDALLPKLISGEIRVGASEELAGASRC